jgi:hypothetical protein
LAVQNAAGAACKPHEAAAIAFHGRQRSLPLQTFGLFRRQLDAEGKARHGVAERQIIV